MEAGSRCFSRQLIFAVSALLNSPEGVIEKRRALSFKEQCAEKTARKHWVLAKQRGCLQNFIWSAATADDLSILEKGAVYVSSLHHNCMCSCVCDMGEQ